MKWSHFSVVAALFFASTATAGAPSAFAFGPNNGWVIVYENSSSWGYRFRRLPQDLAEAFKTMSENEIVLGVGMNEHSWILIGSKTWRSHNLPDSLTQYIQERRNEGYQIIDAALTRSGNWVLISRKGSFHAWRSSGGDIPSDLHDYLHNVTDKNYRMCGVGISPDGGWAACYRTSNQVIYRMRRMPADAVEYTDEIE